MGSTSFWLTNNISAVEWHTLLLLCFLGSYFITIRPKKYILISQGLPNSLVIGPPYIASCQVIIWDFEQRKEVHRLSLHKVAGDPARVPRARPFMPRFLLKKRVL